MLAGPSELLVLADHTANAETVAADLLAQAEHDTDAAVYLVTTHEPLIAAVRLCVCMFLELYIILNINAVSDPCLICLQVEAELTKQLHVLPTAEVARVAVDNGFAVCCPDLQSAIDVSDVLAPEHLELLLEV